MAACSALSGELVAGVVTKDADMDEAEEVMAALLF
jgi:hypothetical protein